MDALDAGYRLVDMFPDSGIAKVYLLASGQNDSDTAVGKLAKKKGGAEKAQKISALLKQASDVGISMFSSLPSRIRRIKGDLVELKVQSTVIRAMCYQRNGSETIVVIDVFDGHQGSGNISRQIDTASKKIPIVEGLLDRISPEERSEHER